ncbi:MAG: hypothetical protein KBC33_00860 [Candidatus Pacebacteria bacterium]|nr:hypothetical protein [Candidatus Paceibacterota bacterium]
MIDLPTQKDMAHPHHRRAVWALVAAGVLLGAVLLTYYLKPVDSTDNVARDRAAALNESTGKPVPAANLTAEETAKLKTLVNKPVPSANLTTAQLEQLRKIQAQ